MQFVEDESSDVNVVSDASPILTPTPTSRNVVQKKRKQNVNDDNTQEMKKLAFEGLTKALAQENETPYHVFGQFVTSELLKLKETRRSSVADSIQRKLNRCLLNELDNLESNKAINVNQSN